MCGRLNRDLKKIKNFKKNAKQMKPQDCEKVGKNMSLEELEEHKIDKTSLIPVGKLGKGIRYDSNFIAKSLKLHCESVKNKSINKANRHIHLIEKELNSAKQKSKKLVDRWDKVKDKSIQKKRFMRRFNCATEAECDQKYGKQNEEINSKCRIGFIPKRAQV